MGDDWISVERIYSDWPVDYDEMQERLDQSLSPRSPEMLYDALATLGVGAEHMVLDIGCGEGAHSHHLAERFGCTVVGVDLVWDNLRRAREDLADDAVRARVAFVRGAIEAIPLRDASCVFVWCRDILGHIERLDQAISECARVLRPGGGMVVFTTFATALLEPREAAWLFPALAAVPASMSPSPVEAAFRAADLEILVRDEIGSEWREWYEEDEIGLTSRQLLHLARLRRARDRFIREFGPVAYHHELANCYLGVYIMLGKFCPVMYVLRKPLAGLRGYS